MRKNVVIAATVVAAIVVVPSSVELRGEGQHRFKLLKLKCCAAVLVLKVSAVNFVPIYPRPQLDPPDFRLPPGPSRATPI